MSVRETIAVIGCGNIADTHVEAVMSAMPGHRICVCDPLPGKAQLLKEKYGLAEAYLSVEQMLVREVPLGVHVLSPPQWHAEHVEMSLEHGSHVLVEKPMCLSRAEAVRLLGIAASRELLLAVDHSVLYQPSVRNMLSMIGRDTGETVVHVSCFYGIDVDTGGPESLAEDHWKRSLPGGILLDTVIHPITLAVELTGEPADTRVLTEKDGPSDGLMLAWQSNGSSVSIIVSAKARPFRRVTEVATNSRLYTVDHSTETLVVVGDGAGPRGIQKVARNLSFAYQISKGTLKTAAGVLKGRIQSNPGTRALVQAFYDHLSGRGAISVGRKNIISSVAVLEQVVKALPGQTTASRSSAASSRASDSSKPRRRVLVTGASGFLGRQVCASLVQAGADVVAQVRRSSGADKLPKEVTRIYADLGRPGTDFQSLAKGCDGIIHCAHASGEKDWAGFKRVNVDSACGLYDAAVKTGASRFVMVSSVAVYGVHGIRRRTVDETTPLKQQPRYDFYARSKALAERRVVRMARSERLPVLVLRPGILFSGRGEQLCRRSVPLARDRRLVIAMGGGSNPLPFTRVEVLARTISRLMMGRDFPSGVYNVCGSPGMSSRRFVRKGMARLDIRCRFLTLPAALFRLIGWIGEGLSLMAGRQRAPKISRYMVDSSTRRIHYDCALAARDLGWEADRAAEFPESRQRER
jgi:predicted dehydrogenase/nucleoside-diphosphate-sugar epimerase